MFNYACSIVLFSNCFWAKNALLCLVDKLESFPQLVSNEVFHCIPNIKWICSHVFELGDLQFLGSTQFFTPYWCFR